jgi:hypothetical protein
MMELIELNRPAYCHKDNSLLFWGKLNPMEKSDMYISYLQCRVCNGSYVDRFDKLWYQALAPWDIRELI